MSVRDILEFFYSNAQSLTPARIVLILFISLACGLLVLLTYRLTADAAAFSASFAVCNLVMTVVSTVIMLMISTNIVISLGMVGALSIVRFRTAVKDPRDTVYILWSMVTGLCVGVQYYVLAIIATLFVSVMLVAIKLLPQSRRRFTLIVRGEGLALEALTAAMGEKPKFKLQAMNSYESEQEYIFLLSGRENDCTALAASLEKKAEIRQVNLVSPGQI